MKNSISSDSLRLNDITVRASDLAVLLHPDSAIENWEREVYLFLRSWFDGSSKIDVKTSGSTSTPKTISLQKKHMIASARMTGQYFNLDKGDTALLCLPASYIAGKMMLVRSIALGLRLYIQPPSSTPIINRAFDFVAMTPMQVHALMQEPTDNLDFIQHLIIGGGTIRDTLNEILKKRVHPQMYETYGMTETITHVAMRCVNGTKHSSTFHALPGIQFRVDDKDRLVITAHHLGIEQMPTHDVVELINSSEFTWKGRWDHIINTGGLKISPEVLERQIAQALNWPFFIAGITDEQLGEKVTLFIQISARDFKAQKRNIDAALNLISPKHFIPKNIISLNQFIFTATDKINRKGTLRHYGYLS